MYSFVKKPLVGLLFLFPSLALAQKFSPELELKARPIIHSFALQMLFRNIGDTVIYFDYPILPVEKAEKSDKIALQVFHRFKMYPPNYEAIISLDTYIQRYSQRMLVGKPLSPTSKVWSMRFWPTLKLTEVGKRS